MEGCDLEDVASAASVAQRIARRQDGQPDQTYRSAKGVVYPNLADVDHPMEERHMAVTYEVREGIAYIAFDRREKHNALRDEDIEGLSAAVRRLDSDETANIGILSGNGQSFSSGGDLQARLQKSVEEGSTTGRANEHDSFLTAASWKPVIAAVHGYCLGHALATALLCDHIVATRSAKFQVT